MVQVNDNILLDTNISNVGYRVYEYMLLIKSEPKTAIELSEELNISIRHLRNHLKILVEQNYFTIVKPLVGRSIIRYTINSQRVEEDE
jgi:predicted ArsR family transcriptional regulator